MKRSAKVTLVRIALAGLVAASLLLPVNRWLLALVGWMHEAGAAGSACGRRWACWWPRP